MDNDTLIKLQQTELEILVEVVRICDKHNLQYFLIGGTLLGAIRHKGFIPWDDDLDIAMPRKDYERFLSICKTELNGKYFLHYLGSDSSYWLPFSKVRKNGTLFQENTIKSLTTHKGIFIDVFPLDNASKQISIHQKIQAYLVKKSSIVIFLKRGIISAKSNFLKRILLILFKPLPIKIVLKIQQKIMSFNKNIDSEYFVNLGSNYNYIKQTIPKSKFYPAIKVEFEGILFNAPNDYDYILKRLYGSYMELPPKDKRVTHAPVNIIFNDEIKY